MPALGSRMPATMRPSVDLPQPDSPTRPTTSPSPIARLTSSTARTTSSLSPAPEQVGDLLGRVERLDEALRDAVELDDGRAHAGHAASGSPASGWMAARHAGAGIGRLGRHRAAAGDGRARAARRERAARRQLRERGRHARDLRQRHAALVAARHRADQAVGVGMDRALEHVDDGAGLDDAARHTSPRCGRRGRR